MSNPTKIDTAIAAKLHELVAPQQEIERQLRYSNAEDSYTRHWYNPEKLQRALAERERGEVELQALEEQYTGWSRYWHVTNVNGHVHTSTSCPSCFPDTQFSWRTDLSGLTREEVVAREAHNACSVCMPIAPVEQRAARERYNAEQRGTKAAERQAKKDEKARKAAERASKLLDKVEKAIESMGGREAFRDDYSLYGHDGRKSVYDFTFNLPPTVGDVLYWLKDEQETPGKRSIHRPNDAVQEEATKRGLR
jgi:hypothetical protein